MEGLVLWMLGAALGASSIFWIPVNAEPAAEQDKTPPKIVFDIPPLSERIEIDGKKNPELIPQWDVWQSSLRADGQDVGFADRGLARNYER